MFSPYTSNFQVRMFDPFVEENANHLALKQKVQILVKLKPKFRTNINYAIKYYSFMPKPYNNCVKRYPSEFNSLLKTETYPAYFSSLICDSACGNYASVDKCQCIEDATI